MRNTDELAKYQMLVDEIESVKEDVSRAKGALEQVMRRIKSLSGSDDLKQALCVLNATELQIDNTKLKSRRILEQLREEWDNEQTKITGE